MSIQRFKKKIASGNIEEVFDALLLDVNDKMLGGSKNEIFLLKAQLSNAKKELNLSFITNKEYDVKVSKITFRLLQLINDAKDIKIEKDNNALNPLAILEENAYNCFLTGYTLLHSYKKPKKAELYFQEALSSFIELSEKSPKNSQVYLYLIKILKQLLKFNLFQKKHLNRKIRSEANKYVRLGRFYDTKEQFYFQFDRIEREIKIILFLTKYWWVFVTVSMVLGCLLFGADQDSLRPIEFGEYLIILGIFGGGIFFLIESIVMKNKTEVRK